jgi:NAD+ synthase (glutamine-hydrolysing)
MPLRLALAQINPTVGDLDGNLRSIDEAVTELVPAAPDLIAFPELSLTGYPPEDLLHYHRFLEDVESAVLRLAARHPAQRLIIGAPLREGDDLYNAALLLHEGAIRHVYRKCTLPNYGVFDEKRYFRPGRLATVYRLGSWSIGISICEDIWAPRGVPALQAEAGARLLVNISSSPYAAGKTGERAGLIRHRALQHRVHLAYVNLVGGQDELVFDGDSLVCGPDGSLIARGRKFETDTIIVDFDEATPCGSTPWDDAAFVQPRYEEIEEIEDDLRVERIDLGDLPTAQRPAIPPHSIAPDPIEEEEIYGALVLGTRDYVRKNGFRDVVLGLSGGIDSALTAVIAVDALDSASVHPVTMPGPYTSSSSLQGAMDLARNIGCAMESVSIGGILEGYLQALRPMLADAFRGVTEENLQARIRGNCLMAFSNARGWLVLTTGNKSELAVGYCTLYGDMAGGFAVLKDVPKDLVYRLARWRNARSDDPGPIPEDTLTRPPSAELRPDQKDEDTLPPYPILDAILEARIEREESPEDLAARGFDPEIVRKVYAWIDGNEYKRRQAPPGIKISPRAFGKDRRYPITNRYRAR